MNLCLQLIIFILPILCIGMGSFLFFKPSLAIEIQRKFYEKINWRIEPISMQKEIRNTKIMGIFLVVCTLLVIILF